MFGDTPLYFCLSCMNCRGLREGHPFGSLLSLMEVTICVCIFFNALRPIWPAEKVSVAPVSRWKILLGGYSHSHRHFSFQLRDFFSQHYFSRTKTRVLNILESVVRARFVGLIYEIRKCVLAILANTDIFYLARFGQPLRLSILSFCEGHAGFQAPVRGK